MKCISLSEAVSTMPSFWKTAYSLYTFNNQIMFFFRGTNELSSLLGCETFDPLRLQSWTDYVNCSLLYYLLQIYYFLAYLNTVCTLHVWVISLKLFKLYKKDKVDYYMKPGFSFLQLEYDISSLVLCHKFHKPLQDWLDHFQFTSCIFISLKLFFKKISP